MRFFIPENVFGSKKLVDIQSGDMFAFETEQDKDSTKRLLTETYQDVGVIDSEEDKKNGSN